MLDIGRFSVRDCQGLSRRSFLKIGAALPLASQLPFANHLSNLATAAESAHAKSIMLVWLLGGPSHLDLFDPKPHAPMEYRGPFSTIATKLPGVRFTELLPQLAGRSDRFSLVRTNVNYDGGHRPAGSIGMTGSIAADGGEDRKGSPGSYAPNFGSILARHRRESDLPGFMSIGRNHPGDGNGISFGYGGGNWGKRFDPFLIACSEAGQVSLPELKLLEGLDPGRLTNRRLVLKELDEARRELDSREFEQWDSLYKRAYSLLNSSETIQAFDLSTETEETRRAYGKTSFGQSCPLGRRLVEAGVPYVQVNWSQFVEVFFSFSDYGWDTHSDNFGLLADWHGPLLDRVFSALLDDLEQRGLLETTLVVCMGEFGRTPRINDIASRDHWHPCYFSLWAGGGVKPGRVVGTSDANGEFPAVDPVTPEMVGTTMLELAGMASAKRVELGVLPNGRLIDGLL
ncbi:MAG: DUF1501 domain-containing protein [Planctomycetaceae bacterium]